MTPKERIARRLCRQTYYRRLEDISRLDEVVERCWEAYAPDAEGVLDEVAKMAREESHQWTGTGLNSIISIRRLQEFAGMLEGDQ